MHLRLQCRQTSVWLSSECKIRGKSNSSTEVIALVKPLPNLPQLSRHHLPLQCARCPSRAMCHRERISLHSHPLPQAGVPS